MKTKRILITGHEGYIGSVMTPMLAAAGYDVVGWDNGYFRECTLYPSPIRIPVIRKDIRNAERQDLQNFEAVIHLAALSNDPIGNLNDGWTEQINYRASVRLAELAREAGVSRFLFSSSCIMYGMSEANEVNEDCVLDPKTEYARSKVKAEKGIAELASDSFSPTYLRNGTVYGLSPRMRFDTVFNDLMASAVITGKVTVFSDGKPWRPVIHVEDVARAFQAVLEAPRDAVHNRAFNIGANHLNYQVQTLARIATDSVPNCELEITSQPSADQRTYKSDFTRFASTLPNFKFNWTVQDAAAPIRDSLTALGLDYATWKDRRFTRLKWLNHLLSSGALDSDLCWRATQATAAR
jgi:nucleoside-diphosphate-sugar epimerase